MRTLLTDSFTNFPKTSLYFVGLSIYRLYLHPLAKFPGPRLNAVSPLPVISALIRGRLAMEMKQMHDVYGKSSRSIEHQMVF